MKKRFVSRALRSISSLALLMVVLSVGCFADNEVLNLKADTDDVVRNIGLEMFGVGGEWGAASSMLAINYPQRGVNTKLVKDLKESGLSFGFYRQAGASSVGYRWKEDIGPLYSRKIRAGASALYGVGISSFGVVEMVNIAKAFSGDDAIVSYTINMVEENPQDIADLAEFLLGDGSVNYNGGTNWANVRKQQGLSEPAKVFMWELGNEYDASQSAHMFINSDKYVQQCKEYISAIKSVDPNAKIALCAPMMSAPVESRESYWTFNSLLELEPFIDYVIIHGYVTMDNAYRRDKVMLAMADELQTISNGRIKIVNTEYNAQGTLSEKEGTDATAWGYGSSMYFAGARTVMDAMCRNIKNKEIVATNYYSAVDGTSYGLVYLDNDKKYKPNVTGYGLSMLQNYAMGDVINFELDGFELNKKSECSASVVKDKDGFLNIILVNNTDDKDFYINFDFDKKYTVKQIQTVTASTPYAMNYIGTHEVERKTVDIDSAETANGYELKRLSFAALKLKEAGK